MSTEGQDQTNDQDRPVSLEPEPVESPTSASADSPDSPETVPDAINPPLRDPLINATDPAGTDPI